MRPDDDGDEDDEKDGAEIGDEGNKNNMLSAESIMTVFICNFI